mmetsp:Transcript_51954/g.121649  ORF Transcript_51954/g.121649 Transcript_51954/m.121649 type:complete len:594 (-) Transcript_51954:82-1863(-)
MVAQEKEPFLAEYPVDGTGPQQEKVLIDASATKGYHLGDKKTKDVAFTRTENQEAQGKDLEWNADLPTWMQRQTGLPTMKDARKFYGLLMPFFIVMNLIGAILPVVCLHLLLLRCLMAITSTLAAIIIGGLSLRFLTAPAVYIYHYFRLRNSTELPKPLELNGRVKPRPLLHAVVVVSYKEPMEVLHRTFASIAGQKGLGRKPLAIFATEARDQTRHSAAKELQEVYKNDLDRIHVTEHVLLESETIGKSSNENHALRELRSLIDSEGIDPFEVMVTIVDADSIMSETYLAHVEDHFWRMPDGRRLIFNGPLNTYRNFSDAGLLVQFWEMRRCHNDVFYDPFSTMHPQSNYSLTLGFAAEIDYWTPDNMPEDIHTSIKASLLKCGSKTTVSVPAIICNDLVEKLGDRYTQAKRHQWGITEITYILGGLASMRQVPIQVLLTFWGVEASRTGSFFESLTFSGAFVKVYMSYFLIRYMHLFKWEVLAILLVPLLSGIFRWVLFWVVEILYWRSPIIRQFPIDRPGVCRWLMLILLSPFMEVIAEFMFYIIPSVHCLLHVTFIGELAYVVAPKGTQQTTSSAEAPTNGGTKVADNL